MEYKNEYISPLGKIIIKSNGSALTKLYFSEEEVSNDEQEIFKETKKWLDIYFSGNNSNFKLNIELTDVTDFQREIYNILLNIPYGSTCTYGDIAKIIAIKRGIKKMSSQAVGNAVSNNPICLIIPCHRVIGARNLVGYRYGLDKKKELLKLEHCEFLEER